MEPNLSQAQVAMALESVHRQTHYHPCTTTVAIQFQSPNVNDSLLRQLCAEFGDVVNVSVQACYGAMDMRATITGFVSYKTKEQAQSAVAALTKSERDVRFGQPPKSLHLYLKKFKAESSKLMKMHIRIPENMFVKRIIDKLAKTVATDGYAYEHYFKEKEKDNPVFAFLFLECNEAQYYKWKVFHYMQERNQRIDSFQYCIGNVIYFPPSPADEQEAEKQCAIALDKSKKRKSTFGSTLLGDQERKKFEQMLQELTIERSSILNGMVMCMDNAQCAAQLVLSIVVSLSLPGSRLAKIYLISDILHNSLLPSRQTYLRYLEHHLALVFSLLNESYHETLRLNRLEAATFKEKMLRVLQIWSDWTLYNPKFLNGLECTFLKSEDEPFRCDLATEEGVALKRYESKLLARELDLLEAKCRKHGLLYVGSKEQMITRLLRARIHRKQISILASSAHPIYEIDGEDLTPVDLRLIEEHKVQVVSLHDVAQLFHTLIDASKPAAQDPKLQAYSDLLKQAGVYSQERMLYLCGLKRQEAKKTQPRSRSRSSSSRHKHKKHHNKGK